MKRFLAAATALALIAGCAPSEGEVKDKRFTPPSTRIDTDKKCITRDKKGNCTAHSTKLDTEVVPAVCEFLLYDGEDEGWTEVPCEVYDGYNVGDHFE